MVKHPVSERWSWQFRESHENRLSSVYMRNLDRVCQVADNSTHFEYKFDTIRAPHNPNTYAILTLAYPSYEIRSNNTNFGLKTSTIAMRRIVELHKLKNGVRLGLQNRLKNRLRSRLRNKLNWKLVELRKWQINSLKLKNIHISRRSINYLMLSQ
jgi:hypothetical protein